ncbi:MAG TPA: hypothetical protein VNU97_12065 [Rhizomicrobium sp.]|jgi:hypothetical protein|nr:hypothetical protein [Rhizomicrobium sp.]
MRPPWIEFPKIPAGSIGWRMGDGEGYYNCFYKWFSALDTAAQAQYQAANPAPRGWSRFYQTIVDHPWRT